jgi:hypothetical protein
VPAESAVTKLPTNSPDAVSGKERFTRARSQRTRSDTTFADVGGGQARESGRANGAPARSVTTAAYDTDHGSLLAENLALGERLRRLSPVLAGMARDLAATRREAAALRRENDKLRQHIEQIRRAETVGAGTAQPSPTQERLGDNIVASPASHCTRCGLTIPATAIQSDRTLILAACCPRCDGQLALGGSDAPEPAGLRTRTPGVGQRNSAGVARVETVAA